MHFASLIYKEAVLIFANHTKKVEKIETEELILFPSDVQRTRRSREGPGVAMRDVLLVERVDGDGVGEEEEGAQQEQVVHLET